MNKHMLYTEKQRDATPGTILITIRNSNHGLPLNLYGDITDYNKMCSAWIGARSGDLVDVSLLITMNNNNITCIMWKDICLLEYLANDR
jgi:hypothetical protein